MEPSAARRVFTQAIAHRPSWEQRVCSQQMCATRNEKMTPNGGGMRQGGAI